MACPESFVVVRRTLIDDGSRPSECCNVLVLAHVKPANVSVLRGLPVIEWQYRRRTRRW